MAFSLGSITYTISRLIDEFGGSEPEPIFDRNGTQSGGSSILEPNSGPLFDDSEIADVLEKSNPFADREFQEQKEKIDKEIDAMKQQYDPEKQKSPEFEKMVEKLVSELDLPELPEPSPEKQEPKTPEQVYQEITVTEYFMKYNYDFGDMHSLRMRHNFVQNAGSLKEMSNEKNEEVQAKESSKSDSKKAESAAIQMRKEEEVKYQRDLAEKYTKLMTD